MTSDIDDDGTGNADQQPQPTTSTYPWYDVAAATVDINSSDQPINKISDNDNSSTDQHLVNAVCVLSGIMAVFVFYQFSLSFVALKTFIWPGKVFTDVLGGSEYAAATVITVLMLPYNGIRVELFYIASALYLFTGLAFPLVVTFLPGLENFQTARALLIGVSILTGIADGLISVVGYGLAAVLPRQRVALRAAGCALAGSLPWAIFQVLSSFAFEKTESDQKKLIWVFMSSGVLFSIPMLICLAILQQRPWFQELLRVTKERHEAQFIPGRSRWKQTFLCGKSSSSGYRNPHSDPAEVASLEITKEDDKEGASSSLSSSPPSMDVKGVLNASGVYVFCATFSFLVFGMLFPIVAPYQFYQTYTWTTILNGVGQVAHTLMRFATVYIPFIRIRPHWLLPIIVVRAVIFFPFFMVIARFPSIPVIHDPWFLSFCMMLFNGFHGWAVVLSCQYIVQSVQHNQEKAIASKIITFITFASLGIAQFASKLTTL